MLFLSTIDWFGVSNPYSSLSEKSRQTKQLVDEWGRETILCP